MKLNDQIPGLPEWPVIELDEGEGAYVVRSNHIAYSRYRVVKRCFDLAALIYFIALGNHVFRHHTLQGAAMIMLMHFIVYFFLFGVLPIPKWVCWLFFRGQTCVRFTPQSVVINGSRYAVVPGVEIQFRANRTELTDESCRKRRRRIDGGDATKSTAYPLQFRRVEMVYGARVVAITSIDDEDRAEQFAIGLQIAYKLSRSPRAPERMPAGRVQGEESLPE